jgi:hypothetical protein
MMNKEVISIALENHFNLVCVINFVACSSYENSHPFGYILENKLTHDFSLCLEILVADKDDCIV